MEIKKGTKKIIKIKSVTEDWHIDHATIVIEENNVERTIETQASELESIAGALGWDRRKTDISDICNWLVGKQLDIDFDCLYRRIILGRQVRALREDNGITIESLAKLSGITKGTIGRIEAGQNAVKYETLQILVSNLGSSISIDYFGCDGD